MYFNIHTHSKSRNALVQCNYPSEIPEKSFASLGIHPWNAQAEHLLYKANFIEKASNNNILAIGECGLDKICSTDFSVQQEIFEMQIEIAQILEKPLLLHCVRSFSEIFSSLKKKKIKKPIIFHAFNGSSEIAQYCIKQGFFLSFGQNLCNTKSKIVKIFPEIPIKNIFLETDETHLSIEDIYAQAAILRCITVEELKMQIYKNLCEVFLI